MKKEKKITHYYTSFFREIAISRTKKLQLMILYTTCSLRPENTIHSDQQNKKSHPLCVLYPTLPIKKMYFVVLYIGEKCQKTYYKLQAIMYSNIIIGQYFTKQKQIFLAGLFLKKYITVDDV